MKTIILLASVCVSTLALCGDVWSDVAHYWSFDKDINGDGVLQTSEVRDVRFWGSTNVNGAVAGGLQPSSIAADGNGQHVTWQSGSVDWPARGVTIPNTSWIHFSCTTNFNVAKNELWGQSSGINFPSGNNITGDVSVVTRVRVERFGSHPTRYAFLLNNGEYWSVCAGANIGFQATNTGFTNGYPFVMLGRVTASMSTFTLKTNTWYDVGYSIHNLGDGKAQVLFMAAGVVKNSTYQYQDALREQTQTIASGAFTNEAAAVGMQLRIGSESIGGYEANALKGVVGDVHRVAMWKRALSRLELAEALGQPATYFQAGIEDDANGEFGQMDERDVSVAYAPDTAPWREMPRALSADSSVLKLTYTPRSAASLALGTVFRLKVTSASEAQSTLSLKIGSTYIGTRPLTAGGVAEWFVKGGTLVAGANAIEVTRVGGSGTLCAIDKLELTGSFMLGTDDSHNGEFTVENQAPNTMFAMNWNFSGLQRGVVGKFPTDPNASHYIWFKVPESLARRYDYRFTGRAVGQGCRNMSDMTNSVANGGMGWKMNQWPMAVEVNGKEFFATNGMPNYTLYSFDIPRGTLSNGWNLIRTHLNAEAKNYYWFCFDFHKLELLPNPNGTLLILR